MAFEFNDLILEKGRDDNRFKKARPVIPGTTTDAVGRTTNTLSALVSGEVNIVWVRFYNDSTPAAVLNNGRAPYTAGVNVLVGYLEDSTEREVLGLNKQSFELPQIAYSLSGQHTHIIERKHLAMFKTSVSASGGLTVDVGWLEYDYNGIRKYYIGDTGFSLSAHLPAAGLIRFVLLYVDGGTNVLTVLAGDTVAIGSPNAPRPDPPLGALSTSYVRLQGGQTLISSSTDIFDARRFFAPVFTAGMISHVIAGLTTVPAATTYFRGLTQLTDGATLRISNGSRVIII